MRLKFTLLMLILASVAMHAQTILLQETFQDWTPEAGVAPEPPSKSPNGVAYTITKKLADDKTQGTFSSNALIVAPTQSIGASGVAEGNGNPSKGRIVMKGARTYLELPKLPSVGVVKIIASAGTDLKEFRLQASVGNAFEDIAGTITPCEKAVTKLYTFNINIATPTTIRILPNSGSSINIWDVEVSAYVVTKK